MKYYIDESGCLGFKPGSSEYLIFSYVIPHQLGQVERAIKRFQKTRKRAKRYSARELMFSESRHDLRIDALTYLSRKDWSAGIIVLEKADVDDHLREDMNVLYNYTMIHNFMSRVLWNFDVSHKLELCIDRRIFYLREKAFSDYVYYKAISLWNHKWRRKPGFTRENLSISHKKSQYECCLQLADYVSGAAYHAFEYGDYTYLDIIRNKITHIDEVWK